MVKGASKQDTLILATLWYLFVHFLSSPAATKNCRQARPLGILIDSATATTSLAGFAVLANDGRPELYV